MIALEIAIVVFLILLNGFFAMSELAVVSARPARLRALAARGVRGAKVALDLAGDPSRFLSAVQVGITLVGILAGAFGGATVAERLAEWLAGIPALADYADAISIGMVVMTIAYLSLVIGELVPKQIALGNSEAIAARVAGPLLGLARVGAPVVFVLRMSTESVLWLIRARRPSRQVVTEEEVRALIAEGEEMGVFQPAERRMLESVLRLADRSVDTIMTPRRDVIWCDLDRPEAAIAALVDHPQSTFPVSRGTVDEIVGVVQKKLLFGRMMKGEPADIKAAMQPPLVVHESTSVLKMLELFRESSVHLAVVMDEYGSLQGVLTPADIFKAITGSFWADNEADTPLVATREDGSLLVSGLLNIDETRRLLGLPENVDFDGARTLAGLIMFRIGRVPGEGDHFTWRGWRFEVVDMDGRRIDKVLLNRAGDVGAETRATS